MDILYDFIFRVNKWLTPTKVFFILFCFGQIIYINSLGNPFMFDDITQIVSNSTVHSFSSIPAIFLNSSHTAITNGYYRPLLTSAFTILYSFFQANSFYFHYLQMLLHIVSTFIIYLIFKRYLNQGLSVLLSLIFLTHPINEETVVYIANLQDVLFLFFGLIAFYLVQKNTKKISTIVLSIIFLFLSILSKESGILFFIICNMYLFLFKDSKRFTYLFFSFITGGVYLLMRLIYQVPVKEPSVPILLLSLRERLINIPEIIFYYIRVLLFPKTLVAFNSWTIKNMNLNTFYMPLIIDFLFLAIVFCITFYIYKKSNEKKIAVLFLGWFILGLAIHLQIVPIDNTVADHFFYFPFIGLLALIGLFFKTIKVNKIFTTIGIILCLLIILMFSYRTIIRNSNWSSSLNLSSHDEPLSQNNFTEEFNYGNALIQAGKNDEAMPYIQKAVELFPENFRAWNNLGLLYYKKGDIEKAKNAWNKSIILGKPFHEYPGTYENMAMLLLKYDNPTKAREFLRKATNMYPANTVLWYDTILASYISHHSGEALFAAKQYFLLKRDALSYYIYLSLLKNQPLQIKL